MLNKVKNILPKSSLKTLYMTLIQSHILYGLLIWGNSRHINTVTKSQKRYIRLINGKSYRHHTEPLLKQCNILKVTDQYLLNVTCFMNQLKYHKLPTSFEYLDYFTLRHSHRTRHVTLARSKAPRTCYTASLPLHKFPKVWNELDPQFHELKSCNLLKKRLQGSLIDNYLQVIHCDNLTCSQCYPQIEN